MRVFYLFEQILPQPTPLSNQVFQLCQSMANAGCEMHLLCYRKSASPAGLCNFYLPQRKGCRKFQLHFLLSSNSSLVPRALGHWLFALQVHYLINAYKPDWVFAAEPSALIYHLKRKTVGVRYGLDVSFLPLIVEKSLSGDSNQTAGNSSPSFAMSLSPQKRTEILMWRDAFTRTDLLITPTKFISSALLQAPYMAMKSPQIISWGSSFTPLAPPLNGSESEVSLLFIASSATLKQLLFLLNAMRLCVSEDRIHLKIAVEHGLQTSQIDDELSKRGLQMSVEVMRQQTQQQANMLMANADAFIHLPDVESSNAVEPDLQLIDYCRLGRPIIAPDIPKIHESVVEGQARAFLFAPDNIPALAIQLRRISDPTLRFLTTSALHEAFEANPHRYSMEQRAHEFKKALN